MKRENIQYHSESFGRVFEHFIFQELVAYSHYSRIFFPIYYWRTSSDIEVDFIVGDLDIAIEVKSTDNVLPKHLKGLKSLSDDYKVKRAVLISMDEIERTVDSILIIHWKEFLDKLWNGKLI